MDAALIRQAQAMAKDPNIRVAQICLTLGVSRNTYYKYVQPAQLKEHGIEQEQPNRPLAKVVTGVLWGLNKSARSSVLCAC